MANSFPASLLCAVTFFSCGNLAGQEEEDAIARRVGIIFEGKFEHADVAKAPEGSKKTQMVASYEWDYGTRSFTEETWKERGFDWERFTPIALRLADSLAEDIEFEFVRDFRGTIEYALFESEDPFLSSILLSPKLHLRLKDSLGDEMFAVILDRHRFYVFPAVGGTLEEYGEGLVDDFLQTKMPVSLEIFLLNKDGLEVVGEIERPDYSDQSSVLDNPKD